MNIVQLENRLGIKFNDLKLLTRALTHRSFLNETRQIEQESNERLEFLGDAVLSFVVSEWLYQQFPQYPEGNLTNLRSNLVKAACLAKIGQKLKIGDYLLLSRGERASGGNRNPTLLANTLEAIIGAIFLDQGLKNLKVFIHRFFSPALKDIIGLRSFKDSKNLLQEKIQKGDDRPPAYKILKQEGPDHKKIFTVGVFVKDKLLASGRGKNKLEAEEVAAKAALKILWKNS